MTAQEWQPGAKAYVEVEITSIRHRNAEARILNGDGADGYIYPSLGALLPVQADDDTIESLRKALTTSAVLHGFRGQADWDETPQYVSCECGEVFEAETAAAAEVDWHAHVIDMQVDVVRDLLAGVRTGRSEAEVLVDVDALTDALEEINQTGGMPQLAGVDTAGRSFLAVARDMADEWALGVLFDEPHETAYAMDRDEPCDECGCPHRFWGADDLTFPVTVLRAAQGTDTERNDHA